MTLCPIALLVTCNKCFAVGFCPLKESLGDYKPEAKDVEVAKPEATDGEAAKPEAKDVEVAKPAATDKPAS